MMQNLAHTLFSFVYTPLALVLLAVWLWLWVVLTGICGGFVARLLRWMVVSGVASVIGGVPRVWFVLNVGGIPPYENESARADSFLFCPSVGVCPMHSACLYILAYCLNYQFWRLT